MKKQQIQNEWGKLILESTQNNPNIEGSYPPSIVKSRELLLLGQVELSKIETGNNIRFHTRIYQTIMRRYFQQKNDIKKEGVELHVDHIKPKYFGGESTVENGQVLCAQHNFIKKTLNQTETGKKMFIRLYELAKNEGNEELKRFCAEILETYEKFNINSHIVWER